jgi:hypothetical protein
MNKLRNFVAFVAILFMFLFLGTTVNAVPILQLYVEGGTYDTALETWVIEETNFNLWVIGNVSGPGGAGPISDVYLVSSGYGSGSISLAPTTTSLVTDPSIPASPSGPLTSSPIPIPSAVENHGEYSGADDHTFYGLGDFVLTDSPIADFVGPDYPEPGDFTANAGQINVYEVSVSGYDSVHFDAYDTVASGTRVVFAPLSHDATTPEPNTLLLIGTGIAAMAGYGKLRTRRRKQLRS